MEYLESVQKFLDYLKTIKNVSSHTLRAYKIDLQNFYFFLQKENLEWDQVKKLDVRSFLAALFDQGLSKKTMNRRLAALRSFFSFSISKKFTKENPFTSIKNPKNETKVPLVLTYPQVELLFSQPDITSFSGLRDKAILELFYSSGLRLSELTGLNHKDFDAASFWLHIFGKGKKERQIPITEEATGWILKYIHHPGYPSFSLDSPIFLNRWNQRISPRSIDRLFKKYLLKSSLAGDITPHTIRHTIATHWLENNMNLKIIQELLGHSNASTTTIYTQVSLRHKKSVHEKFHPHG